MPTDANHVYLDQPGCIEGNVVFSYLDVFYQDKNHLKKLKEHYTKGGLGDLTLKKLLYEILEALIKPIREKREKISDEEAWNCLLAGTKKARVIASQVMLKVKKTMGLRLI
jgi:tryptophanyl-tRNA synthetase